MSAATPPNGERAGFPGPAPHWRRARGVGPTMRMVVYALLPALGAYAWYHGIGVLLNCAVAIVAALATEAVALRLRGRDLALFLGDGSALVTAILLAFCLPPLTPWWVTATGSLFAIGFAKHLYGGLGFNIFNPAMAGYVVLLISFPAAMSFWPGPDIGDIDFVAPSTLESLQFVLTGALPDSLAVDAVARPTTLDSVKTGLGLMQTIEEIRASSLFGDFAGTGWEWVNNLVALGGLWLLYAGVIRWHIPVAMLLGLLVPAALFYLLDPQTHASPGFHLFAGGSMLGAFFVATDPVSAAASERGRLIYGAGIGVLTFVIRTWGSYPDGVAFAVLIMNATVPLIDRYTRPPIYGHARP